MMEFQANIKRASIKGTRENLQEKARRGFSFMWCAGGFVHPVEFVFCGLPHEEEGQDVTGEDGGALPVPGGIGTGVRGRP